MGFIEEVKCKGVIMEEQLKILFVEDDHALAMGTEYALEEAHCLIFECCVDIVNKGMQ